jgi:hypothetical protein
MPIRRVKTGHSDLVQAVNKGQGVLNLMRRLKQDRITRVRDLVQPWKALLLLVEHGCGFRLPSDGGLWARRPSLTAARQHLVGRG